MALGLGIIYALGALGFMLMFAAGKGYFIRGIGRYGFMFLLLLAIFQENIDMAVSPTPVSVGLAFWMMLGFFVLLVVMDTLYVIVKVLPIKRAGKSWASVLFGEQ